MRNSTFRKSNLSKLVSFIFFLLISYSASAQFYAKHYIAPAPWQYFSKANEIVIATNSTSTVTITIAKSDGSTVTTVTATKGAPAIYRFAGKPSAAPAFPFNTVLNAAGLIVTGTAPISINLRNVASDALGGDGTDQDIKGNAALTSFGDAGIGVRFRVGYYRDGTLGNFNNYGDQRPIYSVMAITAGTSVKIGGVVTATLNAGQSYLFKAPIGSLVETSNPAVMNTSAAIDTPGGCGDAAYNQIPPESVLGSEYFIERGKGNDTAEQTTVIATKPNTKVVVESYSVTGALVSSKTTTLATAGSFFTFLNGVSNTNFSASRVLADNSVVVYSGTAQSCEVDISTIAPVSECGGSKFIETAKFRNYGTGSLPYFGYILLKDATSVVYINGANIEQKAGIAARHQLGTTGWYLINFEDTQIGSPDILSISSDAKLTVSIVQQGGGFSMAGFFSNFAAQPEDPTLSYVSGGGCTNSTASLTTPSGFAPYQWYFNGTAISGATSNTYSATKTGSYSVASTLACGAQTQSKPVTVTLCTDLGVTNTVDNATPCVGSNVEFTIKISNLGVNNASGVSVNDLLPAGYTFVSSTQSVGSYNGGTGVWSIGDLDGGVSATLKIVAKVNASGSYNNTATIPASATDTNSSNNMASASTTPNPLPVLVITNPASVCSPSTVDITAPAVTTGSSSNLTFTYWTNATATTAYTTPTQATAGTYYIKATTAQGCTDVKPVVVTVATPPNSGTVAGNQNVCLGGTTTFTSNGSTGGTWSSNNTAVATVNATTGAIATVAVGTATITYTVKGTGGCADANSTRVVTVNAIPTATISGTLTACYTTTLTAVTNAASPAYVWYKDNAVINGQTSSTLVVTADGDYKVKVTNTTTTCEQTSAASTVKVSDTQKPTITCPANVTTVTDANSCAATGVVLGTPTTSDNCSGTVTVTNNAPTSFPIGNTTVIWTATDASGNTQTCNQIVTVSDTQKPTIVCPSNVTASPDTNSCTATGIVLGTPTTSDNCSGTVTVTNNAPISFPIGVTTVTWTARDAAGNTQTCTQTVTIVRPIKANDDTVTSFNGYVGGVAVSSVLNNDVLSCSNTIQNDVTITLASTLPSALNFDTTTGEVSVKPQTPTGTYTFDYKICEKANTTNCSTATVKITVVAPVIDAVTETTTSINGAVGGTTASVILNDTLNGNPAVIGTAKGQVTLTGVTVPAGLTLNANGTVTIAANTPAGNYNLEYSICEVTNSTNCDTVTSIIVVGKPVIDAVTETTTSINGIVGGTTASLITNDTLNGNPAVIGTANGQVTLTGVTVPTGLTLNTDGTVTIAANTPAGNYNLEYSICEVTNPTNCDTATSIIVVGKPVIDAVTETTTSINGAVGGTTASLITNDTLNGSPAVIGTVNGQVTLTGVTVPAGLTLNADGTVTIAANTPAGNYNLEYSICEVTNPTNCDTATSIIVVGKPVIDAVTETTTSINGTVGGTTASLITNDTLNGSPAVIGTANGQVTLTGVTVPAGLTLNADGTVTIAANTPAGNYNLEYSICEVTNPTNCDTATSVIVVGSPVIDAVTETTTSINGAVGGTTASLITNDTLNGNPAVIGTAKGQVTLTGVTVPAGLTLNTNGTVTIAANTPAGNYNLEYSICEVTNPTNCDTATSIIVVGSPVIDAVTETTTSINGAVGGTTASVILNDTLNGSPAVIGTANGQVTLTGVTVPAGLTLNANGTVTIAANTPAGNYNLEYSICEVTNPTNCDTATSVIVVGSPMIDAVTETTTSINGAVGGTTASLITNDTLNGSPAVIGTAKGEVTLTGVTVPTGLTLNANGTVTIAANTPAGNYNLEYSICEVTNPTNCDTVTSIIVVGTPGIDAVIETTTSINGAVGGTTASLITNDTLNGSPAVIGTANGQVTLTGITVPTGLTLNANGTVTIAANTPAGNYNLEYSICEVTNPTNCDTATSIIVVGKPVIDAVTETTTSINGIVGGTTVSLITNDTLNGNPAVIGTANGQVTLTGVTVPAGLTLNANGTVTIAANTPAGNYNLEYSICEVTNPTNCDTATSIIVVGSPVIDAVTETTTSINGAVGGTTASLITNDTLNGSPAVIGTAKGQVTLTGVTVPAGLTLNADGTVTIAANTPAGNYNLEYSICEVTNPTNCDTATSIIVVGKPVIDAVTETTTSINGMIGGTTASLIINDTLNGSPAVIGTANGQVTLTAISVPAGLTLNADGTVTIATGTTIGDYEVEYSICEVTNPTNCDAVKSIISVTGSVLVANNDKEQSVIATNKQEIILNVLDNDTKDGLPVVASDVEITIITPDPTGFITLNNNGTVTLNGNTPAGTYEIIYQICEYLNNTNCSASASIKITVTAPVIDAVTETTTSIDGNVGGTTISLLDNDTVNGNPVSIGNHPGDVTLIAISVPAGLTLNADGTVTVNAGTAAGNYEVEYRICEVNNPTNCDAVKSIVPVTRAIIKANNDEFGPVDSSKPITTAYNIFDNDFLNGLKVSAQDVVLRTAIPNSNFSLNADGSINVVQDTPTGTYHLTYEICEKANLSNCSTATVDLIVFIPIVLVPPSTQIVTNNDALVSVDGINGSLDFINVLDNDLLNGTLINPADVIITNTSGNANFEFNADGTVSVKPNTPGGNYTLTYQVCEKASSSNCSSSTLTVFVEFPSIAIVKTATFNDENANGHANAGETITYRFKVTNTGNVALKNVTVADPLTGVVLSGQAFDLEVNETNDTNYIALYTIKQSDINFGSVSNQATVSANSVRGVVVDDKSDDSSDSEDKPTIVSLGGCEINVMTGFSPNGDGKNARFYIKGLECYPDNTVEIYNRWGVLVFDIDHYNNEDRVFLGYSQGRTTVKQSDGLPVGTYYYILKYKDSDSRPHEKSGYLYLNK